MNALGYSSCHEVMAYLHADDLSSIKQAVASDDDKALSTGTK